MKTYLDEVEGLRRDLVIKEFGHESDKSQVVQRLFIRLASEKENKAR